MKVKKRDGRLVDFSEEKIIKAILSAFKQVDGYISDYAAAKAVNIASYIRGYYEDVEEAPDIEEIQDLVEKGLMSTKRKDVAKAYVLYREERTKARGNLTDKSVEELLGGTSEYWNSENANKNAHVVTTQRDYLAGITSTDITRRLLLSKDIVDAHDNGIIHFHDADYFAQNALNNCCLINLNDMLQNGTVINGMMIEKPHKFLTACTIATQIILGVSSSQYGGCTISLTHLAPFVRDSYNAFVKKYLDAGNLGNDTESTEEMAHRLAKIDLKKEIEAGVQTFNYQVNSMTNTNGQAPFLSVCMYLGETEEYKEELAMIIEEFLNQRILGFKNEKGVYITPAFPKLLYVLEEDNIREDGKYYYLTKLAAQCTAKRMVPDYISEKMMKELKINPSTGKGEAYPCMGCRSFLTPDRAQGNVARAKDYIEGQGKYYGRFNIGVVSINLADVAFSSGRDIDLFWDIFEERLELCHKAMQARYNRISRITSDAAPILWQHGAFARLPKGEKVTSLLKGGYCTLSLGYAGLYECVKFMTKKSHTDPEAKEFALSVMQKLNDKCAEWKTSEDIDYSVYGTPIESTTYKFAKNLKRRFGDGIFIMLDGKDRDYITNSYHVPVFEEIDPFQKLTLESEFQKLSPGGAISYIECADLTHNIPAVIEVIKFIYNNIMYAELNTKSDYCQVCGYDGEIKIIDENNTLDWECPNCGNRDHTKMNVARRTCGYIGTNFFNQGRTDEIRNRYVHLDDHILGEQNESCSN
jgi:ribonucleoside-triphosphate reductase